MQIGIVTDYYRPWPGGISEHVHHEAEELRKRGHDVLVLTGPVTSEEGRGLGPEPDVMRLGFDVRFTENGARSRMVLGRYLFRFRSILRELKLDVLHAHAPLDPFLAPSAIAAAECATVGTFHSSFEPSRLWDTLFGTLRPISQAVFDRLDRRIAVSREAERCISHYFASQYEIIPNGVDTKRFSLTLTPIPGLIPASMGASEGRPTVLFVGRADPRKGLQHLLAAFVEVRRHVPGARLVVVGVEREEANPILAGLERGLADDIVFEGYVSAEDLPRYYASCDVFCSAATGQESQGIVLLEAMASGRPPVAFDIRGYRDVVTHGDDGWLVDEVSPAALADALGTLLASPERCRALGESGRRTAQRYAWPTIAERLEEQFLLAREARQRRAA